MTEAAMAGFGLYLHWPFCQSKCPYCDFNSHVAAKVDQAAWTTAFLAEIDRLGRETSGRVLNSVFFGGGTPSLMAPETVQAILDRVRATWRMANDLEVTLEANPGSVEIARFQAYAAAGVNRVSLGIQALNDGDLRRLGRMHTTAEALQAIEVAQKTFGRVSIDLIYARQDQRLDDWQTELRRAIGLGTDHLSLYQLTIEDGTVFGERFRKRQLHGLPDEDLAADLYLLTEEVSQASGFSAYEVSNYAKTGAQSRHNLIYWRMGDYGGIGPGAHGRLTLPSGRWATETEKMPGTWLERALQHGSGEIPRSRLSGDDQAVEYLMMSLRLVEGSSLERHAQLAGKVLSPERIAHLVGLGLLCVEGDRICATLSGRMVLNSLLSSLTNG